MSPGFGGSKVSPITVRTAAGEQHAAPEIDLDILSRFIFQTEASVGDARGVMAALRYPSIAGEEFCGSRTSFI